MRWLSRALALAGGAVLLVLTAITCLSIAGRELASQGFTAFSQIAGDFEMMELGMAVAIFAFLPWTQYSAAHARVDLFEPMFGRRFSAALDLVAQALMASAAIVIAWRLWLGMLDKRRYGETSMILQFDVWQAYAAGFVGAAVFALVALFCIWRASRAMTVR